MEGPALLAGVLGEVEGCVMAALEGVEEISHSVQVGGGERRSATVCRWGGGREGGDGEEIRRCGGVRGRGGIDKASHTVQVRGRSSENRLNADAGRGMPSRMEEGTARPREDAPRVATHVASLAPHSYSPPEGGCPASRLLPLPLPRAPSPTP